jgi:hypothetical protein
MIYPTKIEVNGKLYNIDTDYRTALACFKAINDPDIKDTERALAVVTLLLGKDVPLEDLQEALEKCAIYLRCGRNENTETKDIDMDYFQDEVAIRTSIRQCYHENLNQIKNLHWWEYNEMIEGLTDETLLSRIRDIRNYDLSKEKDFKIKQKMQKAKDFYALKKRETPLTDEQKKNIDDFMKKLEEV